MIKKWFVFGVLALIMLQSFTVEKEQKIRFKQYSWTDIGRAAKSQKKMIFVLVTADYCGSSRKMKRVVADGKIGAFFNNNFISTQFDAENFMEHYRASNWGVTSVPAMIFLDEHRNVIHKAEGYHDAAAMLKEAQTALALSRKLN